MSYPTSSKAHYRIRQDLKQFEALKTPIWIFDVDDHCMWWGNTRAQAFWGVNGLEELLALDYSNDSEAVRLRLRRIVEASAEATHIQDTWTFYPEESPITVNVDIQPVVVGHGHDAIMVEAASKLDLRNDPESLRVLEAARISALMVSSFTMDGTLLAQNPAAAASYSKANGLHPQNHLAQRFSDGLADEMLLCVAAARHFEAELAVSALEGERIHRVIARRGRDPVTGEFVTVVNEEDVTEQANLRLELECLNRELEARVEERTARLAALNEQLAREITERQETEEQLRRAHRMEVVGQLTGGIAHDFNNLLTVIVGSTELLEDDLGPDDVSLSAIRRAALQGADLTHQLLAFARQQPLNPLPLSLDALISDMRSLLKTSLGESIEIRCVSAPDQWNAMADPSQLQSAILNLALNARDAMRNGGTLLIESQNVSVTDADVAGLDEFSPGDYVAVSVSDTGIGMAPHVMEHAFEPFFSTKEVGTGSGLGLSMVYGFAKQSGGHATITSTEGAGTTVCLLLPRTTSSAKLQAQNTDAPPGGDELILVVEDDSKVLRLTSLMLKRLGYRVLSARDEQAARHALTRHGPVDLILCDVTLSGRNTGPEMIADMRTRQPDLKTVFFSGNIKARSGSDGGVNRDDLVLQKPFTLRRLARTLRDALDAAQ